MITVIFDGIPYKVREGRNLLEAALDHGLNLPYFCWHPAMRSVGSCRQCALRVFRDESDQVGRIQMGCMTEARDGMRANIDDPEAIQFRRSVIEWLMLNHPHDCPVCDEGGECHLQDMTAMTGHVYRRFRGKKRTYSNQNLGPFINHEMNRCIQCYRCVRFYRDLAGGRDFNVFGSRNHVYFGRYEDGKLESELSGNLAEVCPTGVFTDKTLGRHYTRKWDLETAPSICPHCGLGCNTIPGARYGTLRRVQNRYHGEVNGYFLCDRGRFGYEFVNDEARVRQATSREKGRLALPEALREAAGRLQGARKILGIGSGRASLEANYALRALVGEANFSPGMPDPIHAAVQQALAALKEGPARTPSLREVESADAILLLAVDPSQEAPMLDFSIRQAIVNRAMLKVADQYKIPRWDDGAIRVAAQGVRGVLDIVTAAPIKLEEIAREVMHADPGAILELSDRIADRLRRAQEIRGQGSGISQPTPADVPPALTPAGDGPIDRMAGALLQAERPLVVVSAAAGAPMVRAAANIAWAVQAAGKDCLLSVVVPECNTVGVGLMGGRPVSEILDEIESGQADALLVLENDLYDVAATDRADRVLSRLKDLIVLDCVEHPTTAAAHWVLPAAAWAESNGTYVNNEGRAQRFFQVFLPQGEQMASWEMLAEIRKILDPSAPAWGIYEEATRELSQRIPAMAAAIDAAPSHDWRIAQMKIARQPHRYSGRTAMKAHQTVFEPRSPADPGTPFGFTMEGYPGQPPSALIPRFWAPGWNSVQSLTRFQEEVNGPLRGGNPGVRLIDPGTGTPRTFQREKAPPLSEGELWLVPVWKIFGSERLSRLAVGIRQVIPAPTLGLNPEEASTLGVREGEPVEFSVCGQVRRLPVQFEAGLPRRVATLPAGYPETRGITSPMPVVLRRAQ